MDGEKIVARARRLVGVRFRPQGRDPATGLDCVGLVAATLGIETSRRDYTLRGGSIEELDRALVAAGFWPVGGSRAGDVLVMRTGPEQLHLGILTNDGLVHADAGLRRIVERPGSVPWPVLGTWRMADTAGEGRV